MGVYIDNDAIKFLEEYKEICKKYVKSASILSYEFNDGSTIGARTALECGLGIRTIEECL